jgi:hypothetical protein
VPDIVGKDRIKSSNYVQVKLPVLQVPVIGSTQSQTDSHKIMATTSSTDDLEPLPSSSSAAMIAIVDGKDEEVIVSSKNIIRAHSYWIQKFLGVLVLITTLSAGVCLYAFITINIDSDDDNKNDDMITERRTQTQTQTPLFTFNATDFPNADGPFNRTFGIGGQQQPSRPKYPLSSLGGIFSTGNNSVAAFNVSSFAASGILAEGDFGSNFPVPFSTPDTTVPPLSTTASTTTSTTTSTVPPPLSTSTTTSTTTTTTTTVPPPLSTSTTTSTTTTTTTTTTTAMVPAPVFFFAQDPFNGNNSNRDLDTHPKSFAKRNDFLDYFNQTTSSPQQSFENFTAGALNSSFPVPLSTIGNVAFSGSNLRIYRDGGGNDFSTEASQSLLVGASTAVNIFFPVVVVGVGFTIYDLERAIQLQFILNGTNVEMITLPLNTSISVAGVVFIGYINYNGFDAMDISSGDGYSIDQFTAYQASELLSPLP